MRKILSLTAMYCVLMVWCATPAPAQEEAAAEEPEDGGVELSWGIEGKAHYRDSELTRAPVTLPPQVPTPPGGAFLETVDEGEHFEVSVLTLFLDAVWGESLAAHAKLDAIDLYDRNPTSEDHKFDVDEVWIRFGRESQPAVVPERPGVYVKVGKMPKWERQNDRHLESYGLVSTAFNRFEDAGIELGADLGRHVYLRLSATQGNPLFIRDPNALAGDNGTSFFLTPAPGQTRPPLQSGFPIFYDAEVEDVDSDGDLELGGGLGFRTSWGTGADGLDVLVWTYRRELAEEVDLNGTFYGGDLDLLRGPLDLFALPITGNDKEEIGGNLWLYLGGLSVFAQYVDQDLAGLERTGIEGEVAYRFELPVIWGLAGRQLFPTIAPAFRYSKLDPDYRTPPGFPAPSVAWDWEKLDYGLRVEIVEGVDVTLEYAANTFTLFSGRELTNDELLATLRFRM